jgi:drug/metabolite transporter (DMT)-like permease
MGKTLGYTLAATTGIIWGGQWVVGKSALGHVDAFNLTALRYGAAALLLLVVLAAVEGRQALRLDGRGVRLFLLGTLGFAGFNLLAYAGLNHASPESASLITALSPLLMALVLWARGDGRPARSTLVALGVAIFGVLLVIGHGDPVSVFRGALGWGDLLVLGGVAGFILYTVGARDVPGFSPLRYTALTASLGWLSIAFATLIADATGAAHIPSGGDVRGALPQLAYITILGVTNPALFNVSVQIWTRTKTGPWVLRTSRLVAMTTGYGVQNNKAVVGTSAFAHESGIHQHGVLSNRATYEIMDPVEIGLEGNRLVLGKHSGRHAFIDALSKIGIELDESALNRSFTRFKDLADRKVQITDQDLEAIVAEEIGITTVQRFTMASLELRGGTAALPTAHVVLAEGDGKVEADGEGNGMIDAAIEAVSKATGVSGTVVDFRVSSVTGGGDALGDVVIQLESDGVRASGRGVATDVVEASTRAYLNAVNKIVRLRERPDQRAVTDVGP